MKTSGARGKSEAERRRVERRHAEVPERRERERETCTPRCTREARERRERRRSQTRERRAHLRVRRGRVCHLYRAHTHRHTHRVRNGAEWQEVTQMRWPRLQMQAIHEEVVNLEMQFNTEKRSSRKKFSSYEISISLQTSNRLRNFWALKMTYNRNLSQRESLDTFSFRPALQSLENLTWLLLESSTLLLGTYVRMKKFIINFCIIPRTVFSNSLLVLV